MVAKEGVEGLFQVVSVLEKRYFDNSNWRFDSSFRLTQIF